MIINILVVLAILAAIFALFIISRPDGFVVARTASMSASPAVVFDLINDLRKFQTWSPFVKLDPNAKYTYEGPSAGEGASFSWDGNSKAGAGRMTNIESRPDSLVRYRLDFRKPFAGTNYADFTVTPEAGQTVVTWSMTGQSNFIFKVFGLFMDCDKMVGPQFEEGLTNLRAVSEAATTSKMAAV